MNIKPKKKINAFLLLFLALISGFAFSTSAQIDISVVRDLGFGDFYPSSAGGWIEIDESGSLTSSGVIHLGGYTSAAEFTLWSRGSSRMIFVSTFPPEIQLTRTGGGGSMTLEPGPVVPSQYEHPKGNYAKTVRVGGRLTVGSIAANPPGQYSGTFELIIHNQ